MIPKSAQLSVAAIALLCVCSSVLLSSSADAVDGNGLTASTESSVIQGNSAYCYVYIESLEDIASLDIQVHYDTEMIDLDINNAYNSASCSMYDSSLSNGCLNFSYLFDDGGSDSQTLLFYFMYTVSSEAAPGTTYFDILVNEAYDQSLDPADVSGCRCSFDIAERTVTKNCSIYTNSTQSTSIDGTFDLSYSFSTNQILSGSVTVTYDSELFELVSLTNGSFLDGKTVDSNTSLTGSVYLSFVSLEYGNGYDLMTLRFRTLQNVSTSSQISIVVSELYDDELNLVQCNGCSTTVNIAYDNTYVEDKPAMYCESSYDAQADTVTVQINLEANSHLGAGDFILNFDTSKLTYSESTKGFSPSFFNVNDKEVGEGKLKFSIISMEDIVASNTVLTVVFTPIHACTDAETTLTLTGSGLTDSMTEAIILNIRGTSQTIPLRHSYVDTVTEPTCTSGGYTTHECSVCGHSYVDSQVDALGHDLIHHDAKAPTCTEVGWDAYDTCSRCDFTTYHELAALGHDLVHHDAKSPTCTEVGWNTCDTCSRCDYTTYQEIPSLGHDYVATVTQPTCTEGGYTTHVCSRCTGSYVDTYTDALGHDLIHHDAKASTCTEVSWEAYDTCSRCDYSTYQEIVALGHDLIHHDAKSPTCTEIGWDAYDTCSRCDYTTYHELVALGHNLVHHDAQSPTCTEIGWEEYYTCSRCDYSTYLEIPVLGHDLIHHDAKAPTCTEVGWDAYDTCSRCDYTTYHELAVLGHDITHHDAKAPTCTEIGWSAYDTCSRCSYTTYSEIPALGHDYSASVTHPTCTERGYTTHTCSRCTDSYIDTYTDALGHDLIHHYGREATCIEGGWSAYDTCSRCDYTTYSAIPALGHDPIHHDARAATCTDVGWNAYDTCSRCSYSTYQEIAALGHDLVHHDAKAPTCTEIGWNEYDTCSRCNHTTYSELGALGHTWSEWSEITSATEDSEGEEGRECSVCHATDTRPIPKLGHIHQMTFFTANESTCSVQGNSQYWQCTKCGRYYSDENGENEIEAGSWLLPLKEHTLVDDSAVDPTCTATGLTAGSHCSECGTVIVAQNVIPALGHSRQHHAHTDSICTENGNIEYWGCTVCGKCYSDESCTVEISKESTVIAYKGHTEVIDEAVAATCTTAGKTVGKHCSVCGEVLIAQTDVPALGHDLIHHDAKAPTCTEVGWNAYDTCSRCDYSTYSELNALGHNHVATVTQPTCTEKGYTTHTCSRCGDSYIDSYIDALGHAYSATYDWSADGKSCTVHIVCSNDSSHKHDIADIIAVSSIKTVAAIGSMGVTTYSVSGTYDGFAYSDSMDVRNIPALEPEIIQKDVQGETTYSNTVAENQTTQITEIFNTAKTNSSSVEVSVPTAVTESPVIIAFDNDAVNAIGGSEVTITANVVENSTEIEEAELVIEVKLEGATFSEGKAKVTVPLTETVPEGKTVKVYFINGNERIDMNAVLVDGNVVFETNHFSTYAIFFEDAPSDNGSEGFPIVIVIGVVVAIALVSCAVIFLRRH